MDKVISSDFSVSYCIFIHGINNSSILKFYFYEQDLMNDQIIALQHFGKSISRQKSKYIQEQDIFIFDEKNLYNFVNKLHEFIENDAYPKNTYITESTSPNSPTLHINKKSDDEFAIARSNNIYDALDRKYNWSVALKRNQVKQLLDELGKLKNKILENSCNKL